MGKKLLFLMCLAGVFAGMVFVKDGFCYKVPPEESNIKYLYVFGQDGKKTYGARKAPQVIFIRVPDSYKGDIEISIYDPDVGGAIDEKSGVWNTTTRFSIFGGDKACSSIMGLSDGKIKDYKEGLLLESQEFGEDLSFDKTYYRFSPIPVEKGEKIDNYRYFKILAEGLAGDDNNVFALEISPDAAEAFGYTLSLRLSEHRGDVMSLYPEIPSNIRKIIEYNYDLDPTGGAIRLISPSRIFGINGSGSGVWANTKIDVSPDEWGTRWVYEITKDRQPNANMAMYLTTEDGTSLPVFFKGVKLSPVAKQKPVEKEAPWLESKLSCNTFTFDASKSYDPDNQKLTYFWDFGDGTTGDQIRTMHTYKDAGKYLVKLTVTDNSGAECNTATTQQLVRVNQPPCVIAKGPRSTCIDTEITFDGSQTTDSPEDKLTYKWNFGDGSTADGIKVTHKYLKGGEYQVTLTVTDDSGTVCDTGVDRLKVFVNTPPVADAGEDIILCKRNPDDPLEVTFDASKSRDADNNPLTYVWDFGDGDTQEGKIATHRYKKGGRYVAKLLVSDNTDTNCNKSSVSKLVVLNRAPVADAGENMKLCLAEEIKLDASGSYDNDGDSLSYVWDFGDGSIGKGEKVSHKYERGGLYKVSLSVDDGTGTDCSASSSQIIVDVNSTPNAEIDAEDIACIGTAFRFDGSRSNDPDGDKLLYTWEFGDGSTGTGTSPEHIYEKGGLYKVTLYVDDGKNSNCSGATKVHYVKVNTPPVAEAGGDILVCVNTAVELDATKSFDPDNDQLTYTWDFGDGETASGPKVKHVYKKIGTYKVVLTVRDNSGSSCNVSTDTLVATVNAEPVPVIEVI